jgi:hypothetical protein
MTNHEYIAALHMRHQRYQTHRRREQRLNFWIGASAVAFMACMSLVPVLIIINDIWA